MRAETCIQRKRPLSAWRQTCALLNPRNTWNDGEAFDEKADALADRFNANFEQFADGVSAAVRNAAPKALGVES